MKYKDKKPSFDYPPELQEAMDNLPPESEWKELTVDADLEKLRKISGALFSHIYHMGWQLGSGKRDRQLSPTEFFEALKSYHIDDGASKDILENRDAFFNLCWSICGWGRWESGK